jgi:hypothetical protein
VVAVEALVQLSRPSRPPKLGELRVTPAAERLSLRVSENAQFTAAADGALRYTWSVWGRPVSTEPAWSYVPGPEDAGWQQITLEVLGPDGVRLQRIWDVGVVPAVPPELSEIVPPPGTVRLAVGGEARFRLEARVPAARTSDRLQFEWMVDDRPVLRVERPAAGGSSELVLPLSKPHTHRIVVRVTEDGRVAARAEWTLEVVPPGPAAETGAAGTPRPRLVRAPGPRELTGEAGERVALSVRVEPEGAPVTYRWMLDGQSVDRGRTGRYDFRPWTPGKRRVSVSVTANGQEIGTDSWVVSVRERAPPAPAPDDAVEVEAAPEPRPSGLSEAEVRGWLEEYARAWSRKDMVALRRMGQVRSAGEAEKLERYFGSVTELAVAVNVIELRIDGERATVEFERTDIVTDPAGRRQEMRIRPIRKQIERAPGGLRFSETGG